MDEKVLTNEEVDKIIALLNEDKTLDEIREEFGIPHVWGVANLIPPERKEEYARAYKNAWNRRKNRRRKERGLERKESEVNSRRSVVEIQEHKPARDILQDVAKRPTPKSEIVRSEPRRAEEKADWWKYALITLGIVVLGGVFLFALTRGSKPREDQTRESKPRDKQSRESKRMRYRALADKYKVM